MKKYIAISIDEVYRVAIKYKEHFSSEQVFFYLVGQVIEHLTRGMDYKLGYDIIYNPYKLPDTEEYKYFRSQVSNITEEEIQNLFRSIYFTLHESFFKNKLFNTKKNVRMSFPYIVCMVTNNQIILEEDTMMVELNEMMS